MATPHVAGAVARLLSSNPTLSPADVAVIMKGTASTLAVGPLLQSPLYGGGALPPAPTGLVAFPGEGGIGLTWDAVTAADLAGYLVLRGEGADDTLRPITPEPLTATTFTDATARAGVRYTYAVLAVDRATPANRSKESNRVSETGR